MSRSRRTRAAGERRSTLHEPATREVRSAGSTAIIVGVATLVLLRVAAARLPGRWLWGLDLGRDLVPWTFVAGVVVTLAACVPAISRTIARVWPTSRGVTAVLAVAGGLALAGFVLAHPDQTLWTGDTALRHGEFTTLENPETIAKQAMRGDLFLHHTLPRVLAAATGATADDVGRWQGALLAFLTAIAGWRLAKALGETPGGAGSGLLPLAVATLAASSAALALDNGYAKATVELACVTTFLAAPLVRLARNGQGLGTLGALVAAALLLHRSALALAPAWLAGVALAVRAGRARERSTWLGIALPLAAIAIALPPMWRAFTEFDVPFHLTARGTTAPFATAFVPAHLMDVANVLVLLCPMAPLLPLLFTLAPRSDVRTSLAMAALAIPPSLLVLLVPPQQGLARDWDVFAFAGAALAAVTAWRVAELLRARPVWLGLPLALAAIVPALQWAALPTDADRFMARTESLLIGPPVRDREEAAQGLATLGMARYIRNDLAGGRRLYQRSLELSPHPRMLVQWGILADLAGHPDEALGYFRRGTTINPGLASAWQGVVESSAALGDSTSLREAIGVLERLEPANPALPAGRERLAQLRAR